jgi:hypothetical protein
MIETDNIEPTTEVEAALLACVETLTSELTATQNHVTELEAQNKRMEERIDTLQERVDTLERRTDRLDAQPRIEWGEAPKPTGIEIVDDASDSRWNVTGAVRTCARKDVVDDLDDRVKTLESEDTNTDGSSGSPDTADDSESCRDDTPAPETPLEEVLQMPDRTASESLTANQQRARAIAADIEQYATYNHKFNNYSLTATQLRTVLTAQSDDGRVHHQTVKRVREFLDELGDSEVTVKRDRGGTTRLVFNAALVERIERQQAAHGVVRTDTSTEGATV